MSALHLNVFPVSLYSGEMPFCKVKRLPVPGLASVLCWASGYPWKLSSYFFLLKEKTLYSGEMSFLVSASRSIKKFPSMHCI